MSDRLRRFTGGCLCGALRYEAVGEPTMSGHCYCVDCRKASGSGFSPFMVFPREALTMTGPARQFRTTSFRGSDAVRNSCPTCGSLVFGGEYGQDDAHTIYAGSLDDARAFKPTIALFTRDRPDWAALPEGLTLFATMPE